MAGFFFWAHLITAVISALLIIVLAIQLRLRKFKFHREIAYLMAATGILSLIFAFLFGITFSPGTMAGSHNIAGFAALGFSLLPLFIKAKGGPFHCYLGYVAAFFAAVSIFTGFLAYGPVIFKNVDAFQPIPPQPENATAQNLSQPANPSAEPDGINDCPFGLEDDNYPGSCGRYVDENKDGICDHSQ